MVLSTKLWKPEKVLGCGRCCCVLDSTDLTSHVCNTYSLEYNENRKVEAVKLFQCDICPARMRQTGNIRSHRRRHLDEKIYCCPDTTYGPHDPVQCNKRFADPTALIRHRKNAHGYVPGANKAESSSSASETLRFLPYQRPTKSKKKVRTEAEIEAEIELESRVDAALFSAIRDAVEKSDNPQYLFPREPRYHTFMMFPKRSVPEEQGPSSSYQPVPSMSDFGALDGCFDSQPSSGSPTLAPSAYSPSKASLTQHDLDKLLAAPSSLDEFIGVRNDPLRVKPIDNPSTPQPSVNFSQLFAAGHDTPYSSPTSPQEYTSFASNSDWPSSSPPAPSPSCSPFNLPSECFLYPSPVSDATSPSACSDLSSAYWPAPSPQPAL